MAHGAAMKQPILNVTPLARDDLLDIKNDFRAPVTSFSGFRSRFSRSQSPAHPGKGRASEERPKTSSGPAPRRIEDFRGRDTKAQDDLRITAQISAGTRRAVTEQSTTTFTFPISALQTPSKAREIIITSRQSRTNSASPSPAPSLYRSRDTTPLGFREHRAKLVDSRESSRSGLRQRQDSAGSGGYDQRLPLRESARNTQGVSGTHMTSANSSARKVEQSPIGMALGSPSQAPPLFQNMVPPPPARGETMPAPSRKNTPEHNQPLPQIPPQIGNPTTSHVSADKPVKVSKWKLFFGKKSAQDVSKDIDRFAQATTEETEPIKLEVTKGKVARSRTITEKKSARNLKKERPGLTRVTTAPSSSDEHGSYTKDTKAVPFTGVRIFEDSVDDVIANAQLDANNGRRPSETGLLAVDIPSIQMERYSVMFSQLLESTKDSPKKISTSNLLARRQATLDRLKTVNESIAELELEEQRLGVKGQHKSRRMTSPMASPSLSLYPGGPTHLTPSASAAANKNAQRLHRSNTSPAMLSPNRMTFPTDSRPLPVHSQSYTAKDLVASPTSTVSDDAGPPTPDKHGQIVSVGVKKPELKEPEWEMIDGATSTIKMRQRSNTSGGPSEGKARPNAQRVPTAQRVRASTLTHHQPPLASPRTSNSSSISNTGSSNSAASAASTATTISGGSNQRPIPKIKIRHKPALEPYPSGIVPGVPGGSMVQLQNASSSSLSVSSTATSGTSTPRNGEHPERGSSRPQPTPVSHLQNQDEILSVGMRIPVSRFSTAPARRLPQEAVTEEDKEEDEELQIRTAADVSIARQISISRQQSQMLKQRLARGERRRRADAGKDDKELERERRMQANGVRKGEREIRHAIDERGGLLQSQQRGLMPHMVTIEDRKSSYGILEGE